MNADAGWLRSDVMRATRTSVAPSRSIDPLLDRIQAVIDRWNKGSRRPRLRLVRDEFAIVDEWINVVVQPEKAGIRALVYLDALDKIQAAIESEGIEGVMVVPTYA